MTCDLKQQLRKDLAKQFPVCRRTVCISPDSYEMLLSFIPMRDEPDVSQVNKAAMEKGLPVAVPSEKPGNYVLLNGTSESSTFDVSSVTVKALMLVPGVAFTMDGRRLGRGGGWYDRALSSIPSCVDTVGICARERLVDDLPSEPHDMKVSKVLIV